MPSASTSTSGSTPPRTPDCWAGPPRISCATGGSRAAARRARGRIGTGAYAGDTSYVFRGEAGGGLHYRYFPLDTVRAEGGVTGADFRVDRLEFSLGGGTGAGKLSLGGPEARASSALTST
jgi:hypothetical protein